MTKFNKRTIYERRYVTTSLTCWDSETFSYTRDFVSLPSQGHRHIRTAYIEFNS